jgi:hypothetical protein
MKKIIYLSIFFISVSLFAQVPLGIPYQAIAMNTNGSAVANANVGVKLSILDNSATGTTVYAETQTKMTNTQGLFNLNIGQGTAIAGNFATINWGLNTKFLKVEIDVAGGSNYVLVGTTQLMSVPYAMASRKLVAPAGEGITLVAPNGTPYELSVNNSGQLSLPTSGNTGPNYPNNFYVYGSFNNWNPNTALLMNNGGIYKYFTAGTTLKFISQNNSSGVVYGINSLGFLEINGSEVNLSSTGIYLIQLNYGTDNNLYVYNQNFSPKISFSSNNFINPTYNATTNTLSFIVNGVTTTSSNNNFYFGLLCNGSYCSYGDNLSDGFIESGGTTITFPNLTTTPKNFRVDLVLSPAGEGSTYSITQIP